MKILFSIVFCTWSWLARAQTVEVIVPGTPVVKGTAFQVQYIITQPERFVSASTPLFDSSCRVVSGPRSYKGTAVVGGKNQPIQNITYTLLSQQAGLVRIGPLQARFENAEVSSAVSAVRIVEPPAASYRASSSYTDAALYAPRGDHEKMVDENLFLKTIVSKKMVYVGESVVATFKLYSRLQSSSEALNAPSFYGFSVADMLPINEAHAGVEVWQGKVYNTAILRQVQLFPVQAGQFSIDPMHVENDIEFDDTARQQKVRLKKILASPAVNIDVLPLPQPPADFEGAVGSFRIEASLARPQLRQHEEGRLLVRISGAGNFIQLVAPSLALPKGMEVLSSNTAEALNKNSQPLSGHQDFVYAFTADAAGDFVLPPVSLTYFDPQKKAYITQATQPLPLHVSKTKLLPAVLQKVALPQRRWLPWLLLVAAVLPLLLWYIWRRKRKVPVAAATPPVAAPPPPNYLQQLQRIDLAATDDKEACRQLQQVLQQLMMDKGSDLAAPDRTALQQLLAQCNAVRYSPLAPKALVADLLRQSIGFVRTLR